MSSFYETLCTVRTALLNAVATKYIEGGHPLNISFILDSIVNEIGDDFMSEIMNLSETELIDLGFSYLHKETTLMLFPIWLYSFIPDGTILISVDSHDFIKDTDIVTIYSDHWISAGLYF